MPYLRTMRYTFPALLAALSFGCAQQSTGAPNILSEHIEQTEQSILQGSDDFTHDGVLGIARVANGGFGMCTGSLIAPNLMMTARHCVSDLPESYVQCGVTLFGEPYDASEIYATTDQTIQQRGDWYESTEILVPEESKDPCGFDVALVILNQNITTVPIVVPRIDYRAIVGEIFTAVGYGETAQGNGQSGRRRSRDDLKVTCGSPLYCSPAVHSNEFVADTGICSGDSGGPAIDTEGRVFGVVSRGASGCLQPAYADVAVWKDWLIETAVRAADMGGYPLPEWAATGVSGPNPNTIDPNPAGGSGNGGGAGGAGGNGGGEVGPGGADTGGSGGSGPDETGGDGQQFDPCDFSDDCSNDHVCVSSADRDDTFCAQLCASDSDCTGNTWCDTGSGTCADLGVGADGGQSNISQSGTCSVSGAVSGSSDSKAPATGFALFGLAALAFLRRRSALS